MKHCLIVILVVSAFVHSALALTEMRRLSDWQETYVEITGNSCDVPKYCEVNDTKMLCNDVCYDGVGSMKLPWGESISYYSEAEFRFLRRSWYRFDPEYSARNGAEDPRSSKMKKCVPPECMVVRRGPPKCLPGCSTSGKVLLPGGRTVTVTSRLHFDTIVRMYSSMGRSANSDLVANNPFRPDYRPCLPSRCSVDRTGMLKCSKDCATKITLSLPDRSSRTFTDYSEMTFYISEHMQSQNPANDIGDITNMQTCLPHQCISGQRGDFCRYMGQYCRRNAAILESNNPFRPDYRPCLPSKCSVDASGYLKCSKDCAKKIKLTLPDRSSHIFTDYSEMTFFVSEYSESQVVNHVENISNMQTCLPHQCISGQKGDFCRYMGRYCRRNEAEREENGACLPLRCRLGDDTFYCRRMLDYCIRQEKNSNIESNAVVHEYYSSRASRRETDKQSNSILPLVCLPKTCFVNEDSYFCGHLSDQCYSSCAVHFRNGTEIIVHSSSELKVLVAGLRVMEAVAPPVTPTPNSQCLPSKCTKFSHSFKCSRSCSSETIVTLPSGKEITAKSESQLYDILFPRRMGHSTHVSALMCLPPTCKLYARTYECDTTICSTTTTLTLLNGKTRTFDDLPSLRSFLRSRKWQVRQEQNSKETGSNRFCLPSRCRVNAMGRAACTRDCVQKCVVTYSDGTSRVATTPAQLTVYLENKTAKGLEVSNGHRVTPIIRSVHRCYPKRCTISRNDRCRVVCDARCLKGNSEVMIAFDDEKEELYPSVLSAVNKCASDHEAAVRSSTVCLPKQCRPFGTSFSCSHDCAETTTIEEEFASFEVKSLWAFNVLSQVVATGIY